MQFMQKLQRLDERTEGTLVRVIANGAARLGIDPAGRGIRRAITVLLVVTWADLSLMVALNDPPPVIRAAQLTLLTGSAFALGLAWPSKRSR